MAATTSLCVPVPFLFDHLLTSSWAWLAICLATLAMAFRALKISLPRRLLDASPSSATAPPSLSSSSSCSSSLHSSPSEPLIFSADSSASIFSRCRRRTRCKSTSSLHNLNKNGEGLLRSGIELVSSVLDTDILPSLRRITSGSKLFGGCGKSEEKLCRNPRCLSGPEEDGRCGVCLWHNVEPKSRNPPDSNDKKKAFVQKYDFSLSSSLKEEQMGGDEDAVPSPSWLPSWAYSLYEPWQDSCSYRSPSSHAEGSLPNICQNPAFPCFDKQLGWESALQTRLGLSWNCVVNSVFGPVRCKVPEAGSPKVVKRWAGQQRQLLKALTVDEGSALSLDFIPENGLACVGGAFGEVMLWDVGSKVCINTVATKGQPVYALSMNPDHGFTVIGEGGGITLWDQRSSAPSSVHSNLMSSNMTLSKGLSTSPLKSRGHGLCAARSDGVLSIYDVRKLDNKPVSSGRTPRRAANAEDEMRVGFLGMLAFNSEEDFCDEDDFSPMGIESLIQKGGSLVSRFASFLQGMYSSVS